MAAVALALAPIDRAIQIGPGVEVEGRDWVVTHPPREQYVRGGLEYRGNRREGDEDADVV